MHRGCNRWLMVGVTCAVMVPMADVQSAAGGKQAEGKPLSFVAGKESLEVSGELTASDPADGDKKHFKRYTITLTGGKAYRIYMTGSKGFDAYVRLEDQAGKRVTEDQFSDQPADSGIEFTPAKTAPYRIVCTSYKAGMTGKFTLSVAVKAGKKKAKPDAKPAPQGTAPVLKLLVDGKSSVAGTLTELDPRDAKGKFFKAFPFTAVKGKTYRFEVAGKGGLNPFVQIEDEAGKSVKEEDYGDGKVSRVTFHAYAGGNYRVVATTFAPGQTGEFTLSAREIEVKTARPVPLTFNEGKASVKGALTAADGVLSSGNKVYQEFTFQAEAGKKYKIDLASKAFDAYLILKDAAKTLAENDDAGPDTNDSRIVHTIAKAGTYHVIVTSLAGGTGPFVLTVGEAGGADKLASRVEALGTASAAERKQIVADVETHFQANADKLTPKDADLAQLVGETLESTDKQLAANAYATLGKILATSPKENIAQGGKRMLGAARRLNLVGNVMELKGSTTAGKSFDLAKLKGKVVLVDFWATWCPPCRAELPNLRKLYEKYHGQGFEVIGISLDNKESDLTGFEKKEKLPWPSIYKEANDIADYYSVLSIPLPILVGRDGRVLSLNARGAELERLLAEQFKEKK